MKRKFVRVMLFCALTLTAGASFVGCKDYDDDIKNLQSQIDGKVTPEQLQEKLSTMETALNEAKTEAAAAKTAAEAIKATAETALAKAEAANDAAAAAQAKAEAAKADVEIAAAEAKEAAIQAAKDEVTALKTELTSLVSGKADQSDLDALDSRVTDLNTKVSKLVGRRLTSVTLIPELYVGGIPTIEFHSLEYTPKVFDNTTGKAINKVGASDVIVSNGLTGVKFQLNPTGVDKVDIEAPTFISQIAETRATNESPIKVSSYSINRQEGVMTVFASKTVTTSLNLAGNKIYTAALRVPIAESHLAEGENQGEVFVYSEYSRLAESTVTPQIAASPYTCSTPVNHYNDSITLYRSAENAMVDVTVDYITGIDLNTLVTGCYINGTTHNNITTTELNSYGLEFRFAVAKGEYVLGANGTDQQEFASIDANGKLVSKLPNNVTDNQAAVDKEPIIRVVLWDTNNNNLVDQKYIKIKFTKKAIPAIPLGEIGQFTRPLGCDNIDMLYTWDEMTNNIYGKMNDGAGMSKEDFHKIYTQLYYSGDGTMYYGTDVPSAGTYALMWELTDADIATIAPQLSKDYTINMTYSDPTGLHGDVTFSFKATITVTKPSINGYYDQYWSSKYTVYPVYPVHYDPSTMGTGTITARCRYDNNLMNAFTFAPSGFIVKDIPMPCGTWDMQFTQDNQLAGFAPGYTGSQPDRTVGNNIGGYNLYSNGITAPAATLVWPAGHTSWCGNPAHNTTNVTLDKANGGKNLISTAAAPKKVRVGVWATVNGYNLYEVINYELEFIAPLKINKTLNDGEFFDGVYSGSVVSCAKAFQMTDFRNYIVAKTTTDLTQEKTKYASELYQYYEVQAPAWDTTNAKIGMKKVNGSLVVDDNLDENSSILLRDAYANMSISTNTSGDLVFKNNSGSNVEESCNIFIKATVNYGWGSAQEWVKIRLNPAQ